MDKNLLIDNVLKYFSYLLLVLIIVFVWYFAYHNWYISTNMLSLEWDEQLLAITWDVVAEEEDKEHFQQRIEDIKSQNYHSQEDIFDISLAYSDLWKIWKAIVVLENYLDMDVGTFEENEHIYSQTALLYEEICSEDYEEYCYNALEYMEKLHEKTWINEYLLNFANILWKLWEDETANEIYEYYEDLPDAQKQDPEEMQDQTIQDQPDEMDVSPQDIQVEQ